MKLENYFSLKHLVLSNQVKATYDGNEFGFARVNGVYGIDLFCPFQHVFIAVEYLKPSHFEAWKRWSVKFN